MTREFWEFVLGTLSDFLDMLLLAGLVVWMMTESVKKWSRGSRSDKEITVVYDRSLFRKRNISSGKTVPTVIQTQKRVARPKVASRLARLLRRVLYGSLRRKREDNSDNLVTVKVACPGGGAHY